MPPERQVAAALLIVFFPEVYWGVARLQDGSTGKVLVVDADALPALQVREFHSWCH